MTGATVLCIFRQGLRKHKPFWILIADLCSFHGTDSCRGHEEASNQLGDRGSQLDLVGMPASTTVKEEFSRQLARGYMWLVLPLMRIITTVILTVLAVVWLFVVCSPLFLETKVDRDWMGVSGGLTVFFVLLMGFRHLACVCIPNYYRTMGYIESVATLESPLKNTSPMPAKGAAQNSLAPGSA